MTPSPPGTAAWAQASSTRPDTTAAVDACVATLRQTLGDGPPDLVLAFFSREHVGAAETLAATLKRELTPGCLLGASAHGVVTSEHEVEQGPALTVIAGRLPGATIAPFILVEEHWREAATSVDAFAQAAPGALGAEVVLLLGDPFTLDVNQVLEGFNRFAPGVRVAGGMASAAQRPGGNVLLLNDWIAHEGGIAVALAGAVRADVIVSQGCRPIGVPLTITRGEGNVIVELDGQPALERTEQVLRSLPAEEHERLRHGLYVGRPVRGESTGRGDYLIRNLLGADRDRGVLAIGDQAVERERVRLHVRDADTAREDLAMLLAPQEFDGPASAVLLFACNGRGRGLYGVPDGDLTLLRESLGANVPVSGMFCAGEVGPVGSRNFVHGHTASIVVLRPAAPPEARGAR